VGRIAEIFTLNPVGPHIFYQFNWPTASEVIYKKAILDYKMGSFPPPMGCFGSPVWPILGACS
jgi:hypothetical protein